MPARFPTITARLLAEASIELAAVDVSLSHLIRDAGVVKLRPAAESNFASLARAIIFQQLAGAAASAIHRRFLGLFESGLSPEALSALPQEALRSAGLSANKTASLQDLASKVSSGLVALDNKSLARSSDDEIIDHLVSVRGIGPWTAQMFLIFQLRRSDVWPIGDLGVRRGYALTWKTPLPEQKAMGPLGERFRPYRSIVALYCWRACEIYGKDTERLSALAAAAG